MDKQINHDNHHDESKTRTHRLSKLPDDEDPWAPNNLLKSGAKEKHQLDPVVSSCIIPSYKFIKFVNRHHKILVPKGPHVKASSAQH